MADTTESMALAPILTPLATPRELAERLREGVMGTMVHLRMKRIGRQEQDLYAEVRWAAGIAERLDDYGRAFVSAAATARGHAEDLLLDAVGQKPDGPPGEAKRNIKVPDPEGDVQLTRTYKREHSIDVETLTAVVAAEAINSSRGTEPVQGATQSDAEYVAQYEEWMANVIIGAIELMISLGGSSFKPGLRATEQLAAQVARRGDDTLASVVSSAVRSTSTYTGTKMERSTK